MEKKKSSIFTKILIIIVFLGIICGGVWLINSGIKDYKNPTETTNNTNTNNNNNKTLEELESELAEAKLNINNKKEELKNLQNVKEIECDKLYQKRTAAFFKDPNGDAFYEADRNWDNCEDETTDISKKITSLEMGTAAFAQDDDIIALIEAKEEIETKIDDIKNPLPSFTISIPKMDPNQKLGIMKIIAGALILLIPTISVVTIYNKIVRGKNKVNNTFANIDVYLKKRWDLIPSIIESVKGYAAHESGVLAHVTELRQGNYTKMNINEKVDLNNEISKNISQILLLQENYPDLKANTNYLDLTNQLSVIENEIANSRISYNNAVMWYNNTISVFPNSLLVIFLNKEEIKMFNISDEEKENIKVKL